MLNIANQLTSPVGDMSTIKIFQLVQTYLETLGLYSPQTNQIHSSKLRILFFSTLLVLNLTFFYSKQKLFWYLFLTFLEIFMITFGLINENVQIRNMEYALTQQFRWNCVYFVHSNRFGRFHKF